MLNQAQDPRQRQAEHAGGMSRVGRLGHPAAAKRRSRAVGRALGRFKCMVAVCWAPERRTSSQVRAEWRTSDVTSGGRVAVMGVASGLEADMRLRFPNYGAVPRWGRPPGAARRAGAPPVRAKAS